MDRCETYTELISASLDGALTEAEQRRLEAHLASCPACRALMRDLEGIHAALADLPAAEPPARLAEGVMERIRAEGSKVISFPKRAMSSRWRQWRSLGAMAAVFAVVVVGAVGLGLNGLVAPDTASGEGVGGAYTSPAPADGYTAGVDGGSDLSPALREAQDDAELDAAAEEPSAGQSAKDTPEDTSPAPNSVTAFTSGQEDTVSAATETGAITRVVEESLTWTEVQMADRGDGLILWNGEDDSLYLVSLGRSENGQYYLAGLYQSGDGEPALLRRYAIPLEGGEVLNDQDDPAAFAEAAGE